MLWQDLAILSVPCQWCREICLQCGYLRAQSAFLWHQLGCCSQSHPIACTCRSWWPPESSRARILSSWAAQMRHVCACLCTIRPTLLAPCCLLHLDCIALNSYWLIFTWWSHFVVWSLTGNWFGVLYLQLWASYALLARFQFCGHSVTYFWENWI